MQLWGGGQCEVVNFGYEPFGANVNRGLTYWILGEGEENVNVRKNSQSKATATMIKQKQYRF